MRTARLIVVGLSLPVISVLASQVYVVNGSEQFGTVDLGTGSFHQIGPTGTDAPPIRYFGLAPGFGGSLLTFQYDGQVLSISPSTGLATEVGPSGLADCSTPTSPCGPNSAATLGTLNGKTYATDFANNLYSVNPLTGAVTLIGPTGIPAIPFTPGSFNPDGTINFYDEAIFGAGGNLYITFDAFAFNLSTFVSTPVVDPMLYRVDPTTGVGHAVGATDLGIGAVVGVNGADYAFDDLTDQVETLDAANGKTAFVTNFDPAAVVIQGAAAVPEPASMALSGVGLILACLARRRRRV